MAQFDYYANLDNDTHNTYPFIVDVQDTLLNDLNSRVVIPLTSTSSLENAYPKNLCPKMTLKGQEYYLLTHQIASVSSRILSQCEGSLANYRGEIIAAIDFLFTGI